MNEGSLFHYLNRCTTKFGKRLFKRWVWSPLFNEQKLQARLDSVEELVENYDIVKKFKAKVKRFADLERYLWRIYKYSIGVQRSQGDEWKDEDDAAQGSSNLVYVNMNSLSRLGELYILLTQFKDLIDVLDDIFGDRSKVSTKRLKALVTLEPSETLQKHGSKKSRKIKQNRIQKQAQDWRDWNIDAWFEPRLWQWTEQDIRGHLEQFSKVITWKKLGKKTIPEPVKGLSVEFDEANERVESIKGSIQGCLKAARKELELPELKFNTGSKRYRFEFDIPIIKIKSLPKGYFPTTKSKLYQRAQNKELGELVEELEVAEEKLRNAIAPFLLKLFKKFYK